MNPSNAFMTLVAIKLLACDTEGVLVAPDPSLERMIVQPRYGVYSHNPFFNDGMAMRTPPPGTVSREINLQASEIETGIRDNDYTDRIPLPQSVTLLHRGRDRYDIFCSPCHGLRGDGRSVVAENMFLVLPPSLLTERVQGFALGRLFRTIKEGYGVMPSYAAELSSEDIWAVVAYLNVLQHSQSIALAELPPYLQSRAQKALGEAAP